MVAKLGKSFVEIFGKQYKTDGFTNITDKLIEKIGQSLYTKSNNPLYLVSERIRKHFCDPNFDDVGYKYQEFIFESPVVTTDDNFDSLLIPKDHVSRRKADTYYVNSQHLLRSHTSAHQTQCLNLGSKAFISVADCYRRDEIDRSHFPIFHQCEVFKLYNYKDVLSAGAQPGELYDDQAIETKTKQAIYKQDSSYFVENKLKSQIEKFVKVFFGNEQLKTRWVDAYFPFTHPSFELEIFWNSKWMEVLGCGIVRNEILKNVGIQEHIGFAAGFGLERFAMLKYQIPDIRLFWTQDTGFTHQFENKTPFESFTFKPFSSCPQCINDLSFWLPEQISDNQSYEPNDFYDLCRSVGGDLIEQVSLVDQFKHPKTKKISHCYRIVYRAADRVLTKDEVNAVHDEIAETCKKQFQVQIR